MNSPQKYQNSQNSAQNQEDFDMDSFVLTPKAPNLRPAATPEIEFEDFLLPEPLLGEEAFQEQNELDEEMEDFFLDEEPEENSNGSSGHSNTKVVIQETRDQIKQSGKSERFYNRSLFQNKLSENANFTSFQNSDYQMSDISDDLNCCAEGVVELIFRKKSISI